MSYLLKHRLPVLLILIIAFMVISCEKGHAPRPRGYVRIALPEKKYRMFDTIYPFVFEHPLYSKIKPTRWDSDKPGWIDIYFPEFNAKIHITYMKALEEGDIYQFLEDSRTFVNKHIPKSTGFKEMAYADSNDDVYGVIFEILGRNAASPLQFYLTDSTTHFLRGALYFDVVPNNDSLAPVISFIHKDIIHLIETLQWK